MSAIQRMQNYGIKGRGLRHVTYC